MSPDRFDHLLSLVEPAITKQNNNYCQPISADERLCLTIRFLASGDSNNLSRLVSESEDQLYRVLYERLARLFIISLHLYILSHQVLHKNGKKFPKNLRKRGIFLMRSELSIGNISE